MKVHRFVLAFSAAAVLSMALAGTVGARPSLPEGGMGMKRSATPDVAGFDKQHGPHAQFECIAEADGPTVNLDCDDVFPNNEPDIEVNPADPLNMIASSNDYGSCCDQYYTSMDGGITWSTGDMSIEKPLKIGSDPVTTFDVKHGTAIHSSLSYAALHAAGSQACDGDLVVSPSRDGGLTWDKVVVVADGVGCDLGKSQIFSDKEWIVTDNNPGSPFYGRTYVTWSRFVSAYGAYLSSAIFESHSDDGGYTWSTGQEISGWNAALCTYQEHGPAGQCDENQFSVPTVGPDGTVYVAFENDQNESLWEADELFDDQYLLVTSTDGGESWSDPSFVVGLEDGTADYPINVSGRQTLTGYQLRVNSAGNIVASPTDGTLYLVFADNRNGTHDAEEPVTNTDVFLMVSSDGGASWTGPTLVDGSGGDQWFPWVDVDPTTGGIGIVYNDRGAANGALYHASLLEGTPGALSKSVVSTADSDPTKSRYFRSGATGCETCATFHGDYIAISYGSDGVANLAWTEMSAPSDIEGLFYQFITYARK